MVKVVLRSQELIHSLYDELRSIESKYKGVSLVSRVSFDTIMIHGQVLEGVTSVVLRISIIEEDLKVRLLDKVKGVPIMTGEIATSDEKLAQLSVRYSPNELWVSNGSSPISISDSPRLSASSKDKIEVPTTTTTTRSNNSNKARLFESKSDIIEYLRSIDDELKMYYGEGLTPLFNGIVSTSSGRLINRSALMTKPNLESFINSPITSSKYDYYSDLTTRTGTDIMDPFLLSKSEGTLLLDRYLTVAKMAPTLSQLVYLAHIKKSLGVPTLQIGGSSKDAIGDFISLYKDKYKSITYTYDHNTYFSDHKF